MLFESIQTFICFVDWIQLKQLFALVFPKIYHDHNANNLAKGKLSRPSFCLTSFPRKRERKSIQTQNWLHFKQILLIENIVGKKPQPLLSMSHGKLFNNFFMGGPQNDPETVYQAFLAVTKW